MEVGFLLLQKSAMGKTNAFSSTTHSKIGQRAVFELLNK